jgi:predicted transcriptional regulator
MKRTTIFVDPALEKHVQALAERRHVTFASVVREALVAYVADQGDTPQLSFIGAGMSGQRDVAERHEELLWKDPHPAGGAPAASTRRRRRARKTARGRR